MRGVAFQYQPPRCPVDPAHGPLLDFPTASWSFYCPSQEHDGWKDRPYRRPFFTTADAEAATEVARRERRNA